MAARAILRRAIARWGKLPRDGDAAKVGARVKVKVEVGIGIRLLGGRAGVLSSSDRDCLIRDFRC
ncbi:MAG: hypothetical protein EA001_10865 [Oscillatoriales cyanobacterium]|nr:MAG: hypothetical protein EA001_10865 [Oscillatoriales cyanobacterium]